MRLTVKSSLKSFFRGKYVHSIIPIISRHYLSFDEPYEQVLVEVLQRARNDKNPKFWMSIIKKLLSEVFVGEDPHVNPIADRKRQQLLLTLFQESLIPRDQQIPLIILLLTHSRGESDEGRQKDLLLRMSLEKFKQCFYPDSEHFEDDQARLEAIMTVFTHIYKWYLALADDDSLEPALKRIITTWRKSPGEEEVVDEDNILAALSAKVTEKMSSVSSLTGRLSALSINSYYPSYSRVRIRRARRKII